MLSRETSDWSLKRRGDSLGEEQFGDFEEDKDLDEDFDDELDEDELEEEDLDDLDEYDDLDDEFVFLVVELVVQVVVLVEIVQVLLFKLVLVQLVVEVLVQVLVLFEVSELLFAETVAATLERPVRRLTGQHCHPQLGLWLLFERAIRLSPTTPPPTAHCAPACGAPWRPARACAAEWTTA